MVRQPHQRSLRLTLTPLPYTHPSTHAHAYYEHARAGLARPLCVNAKPREDSALKYVPGCDAAFLTQTLAYWIWRDKTTIVLEKTPTGWIALNALFTIPELNRIDDGLAYIKAGNSSTFLHLSKRLQKTLVASTQLYHTSIPLWAQQTLGANNATETHAQLLPALAGLSGSGMAILFAPYHTKDALGPIHLRLTKNVISYPGFDKALSACSKPINPAHAIDWGHQERGAPLLTYPIATPSAHTILQASALAQEPGYHHVRIDRL